MQRSYLFLFYFKAVRLLEVEPGLMNKKIHLLFAFVLSVIADSTQDCESTFEPQLKQPNQLGLSTK
jgi:hypothetical protein